MYFDFEDYRPDTPRVPRAISAREGGILSFFFHFLLAAAIIFLPDHLPQRVAQPPPLVPVDQTVRYVHMAPLVDRPAAPRLPAESSDMDRRSATRERAPDPQNSLPFSRGNTPDKTEAVPEERKAGPEMPPTPAPPAPTPPSATETPLPRLGEAPAAATPPAAAAGNLGSALRNLQRYLDTQNFDNQRGGNTEQNADIQFDSKGVDFGPWLRRFRNQVMRNWLVPEAAMWQRGRVVIQFFVLRNGTIVDLRVIDPSPIDAFNLSAVNALRMSNPTADLPPDYPSDRVLFTVTFHYNDGQDR
jgi:TonB family protein